MATRRGRGYGAALVFGTALTAATARAEATSDPGAFFGVGLGGGTAATATMLADAEARRKAPGFSAGLAELELGWRAGNGLGLALTGQSLDFRGLSRGGRASRDWSGEALGATASWQYRRLTLWAGVLGGSMNDRRNRAGADDGDDWDGRRSTHHHGLVGGKAGLGFALYKSDWMDVKLTGAVEPLLIDGNFTAAESMGRHVYLQQAGLAMTFYPRPLASSSSGDGVAMGAFNCYDCGQLMYWSGRALLEVGSTLGRATADGLFRALAR